MHTSGGKLPSSGNSQCKGPEAGTHPGHLRNSGENSVMDKGRGVETPSFKSLLPNFLAECFRPVITSLGASVSLSVKWA